MADLIRGYLREADKHRPSVRVPVLGKAAAAIRSGANLARERSVGRGTWEAFLATRAT